MGALTVQPIKSGRQSQARVRHSRWPLLLCALLLVANVVMLGMLRGTAFVSGAGDVPARAAASWRVGVADLGERPHLTPRYPDSPVAFCDGVSAVDQRAITDGVAYLRATDEGDRLYALLVDEGVCIGTKELEFNSAYATSRWSPGAGWSDSEIIIGEYYVDWLYPDVIAAILAHEATHIQRAVDGTACYYVDACTVLSNGVDLEEEVVAHEAEARWWIAAYGHNGKDRAFAADASENRLKAAYLQGPDVFRRFVREMRSDKREGEGI
jgi:hypothetical protein